MRTCICMRALHASPYGSQVCSRQFDPKMWGGPYPRPKLVSLRSSVCSFSVRNRTGGGPREIVEVRITSQGTRNGRNICVCAQASLVHVHVCAHLCVYFGVCMDACKLACVCACEHASTKVALSAVCHRCQSSQATHQKFSCQLYQHNNHTAATTTTQQQQQQQHQVCV